MSDGSGNLGGLAAAVRGNPSAGGERGSARGHDVALTRDRFDLVMQHCADLGIEVMYDDLGSKRRGEYHWRDDGIVLSLRLDRRQATATLAHELGHQRFGDRCSSPPAERRAWEYGAAMLITPLQYRAAELLVGHHLSALAIELGVTPKLIEAWRRWWETRGQHLPENAGLSATGEGTA